MKKVVRIVWISALSGLAFLAACCATKGGISKAERKQLIKERDSIQGILEMREMAEIYGPPEIIVQYGLENLKLRNKLDSINYRLGEDVNLEESAQRVEKQEILLEKTKQRSMMWKRLEELRNIIRERESACIYGSTENIEQYGRETDRLRQEAEALEKALEELK